MAVRLDGPRLRVERLMVDEGVVTRDQQATSDDVLNRTTGALTPPTSDTVTIYEGKCLITRSGIRGREAERGGVDAAVVEYELAIPFVAVPLLRRDLFTVTTSSDASLVGKRFRLTVVEHGSLLVWRRASMELEESPYG